ncbi:ABC transporter ATP-binding protein, partial [Salmonella enterica]|uniref:ABC transporter ATP-binding protein n=1 Tax=Salmonella enterica TaxID=28901 RepID=UPI00138F5728
VLKNLKKSFWSVVAIVILLCIQAQADLRLPDFTSRIVNVGIQAGGIETAVPQVISKEDMETILMFSKEDEKILENYSLVSENLSNEQEKVIDNYLGKDYDVEPGTIYVLNDIEKDKEEELSKIMATPLM